MRKPTAFENRVRVRAYYIWLNTPSADARYGATHIWLVAEGVQRRADRLEAARKGAETRLRNKAKPI